MARGSARVFLRAMPPLCGFFSLPKNLWIIRVSDGSSLSRRSKLSSARRCYPGGTRRSRSGL
jgi:hypothetical protein